MGFKERQAGFYDNTGVFLSEKEWVGFKLHCAHYLSPEHRQIPNGDLPCFTSPFDPVATELDTTTIARCLMICTVGGVRAFWIVCTRRDDKNPLNRTVTGYQCRMSESIFVSLLEKIPIIDDAIESVKNVKFDSKLIRRRVLIQISLI
jgi:hypothetical protein